MKTITTAERRRRVGVRHHLTGDGPEVTNIADNLVGIHSSDPVTVYLSCLARSAGFARDDLDRALYVDRSLVRRLGMRRTLFVVPRELAPLLQSGCSDRYIGRERNRLLGFLSDQHGHDEVWLAHVEKKTLETLEELGTATARELVARVPELATKLSFGEGTKWAGEVGLSTRILFFLATGGEIVRARPLGTWISSQYRWAPTALWLGTTPEPFDGAAARCDLAKRWLKTYGPGTLNDIKWWSGWGVRETREALNAAGAVEVALEEGTGFVASEDTGDIDDPDPYAALLPSLDSTPMGWKDRNWFLGPHKGDLYDRNGNIGPTVWVNGRIVGGWNQRADGDIRIGLLESVSASERRLIDEKAAATRSWLGDDRITPRFRTPLDKRLSE